MIRIALIGAGVMGRNHARSVAKSADCSLAAVVDSSFDKAELLASEIGCGAYPSLDLLPEMDAAIIATSTQFHVDLSLRMLDKGVPILVEKPLSTSVDEVARLISKSRDTGVPLMCGFVERFNPVIAAALAMIKPGEQIHNISIRRHSPPFTRASSGVIWDLLIHDIDIVARMFGPAETVVVGAAAIRPHGAKFEEHVEATVNFDSALATLSASRLSQRKIREVMILTEHRLLELDLLRQTLTVYRNVSNQHVLGDSTVYSSDTVIDIPFVRHSGEPLELQLTHFVGLVRGSLDRERELSALMLPHLLASRIEETS